MTCSQTNNIFFGRFFGLIFNAIPMLIRFSMGISQRANSINTTLISVQKKGCEKTKTTTAVTVYVPQKSWHCAIKKIKLLFIYHHLYKLDMYTHTH